MFVNKESMFQYACDTISITRYKHNLVLKYVDGIIFTENSKPRHIRVMPWRRGVRFAEHPKSIQ